MIKTIPALVLAFLMHSPARSSDDFSRSQVALEAGFTLALAADRAQTIDMRDFCSNRIGCTVHEINPFLGSRPSVAAVNRYFLLSAGAHALVSSLLPSTQRSAWQSSSLVLEAIVIGRNKRLGLSIHF